jgi:ubiquinone/menaquinone biosynthesis C-methylase UbiE
VFEHVMDYDAAFREIARVLKPGGLSIHVFPARWRPIEPHIYVPFGARFHSWWFYRFWAMTGIRNEFQQGMSAAEAAERNWIYARTGINYPTKREILFFARRHFDSAYFAEKSYIRFTKRSSRVSRLFDRAISLHSGFERLYRDVHTRVLVVKKKS